MNTDFNDTYSTWLIILTLKISIIHIKSNWKSIKSNKSSTSIVRCIF